MIDLRYESPDISDLDLLALGAHPNSVEQTCGGTLLRMAQAGYKTGILDLTTGDMSSTGLPEQRLTDAVRAAGILKAAWRGNCRFPDARLDNVISARMTLSTILRTLRPKTLILPHWEARHPDYSRTSEMGYEAAFLAGLSKLDEDTPPFRPTKIVYAAAPVLTPSFVVDISAQFEARMEAVAAYEALYSENLRDRLHVQARHYGSLIGVRYGEPYVVKEMLAVADLMQLGSPTF